jgi:hypothetical protein
MDSNAVLVGFASFQLNRVAADPAEGALLELGLLHVVSSSRTKRADRNL